MTSEIVIYQTRKIIPIKFLIVCLTLCLFFVSCKPGEQDPNSVGKDAIEEKLEKAKNENVVFGVDKFTSSKKVITQEDVNAKLKEFTDLCKDSHTSYLETRDYLSQEMVRNPENLSLKNDSLLNEFMNKKTENFMVSMWEEKVYEGNELGNAYWIIGNQIEQIEILKEEIDKLNKSRK